MATLRRGEGEESSEDGVNKYIFEQSRDSEIDGGGGGGGGGRHTHTLQDKSCFETGMRVLTC